MSDTTDFKSLMGEKDYYAREFVFWLWYHYEINDGIFRMKDNAKVTVVLEDKLVLEDIVGEQQDTFKGGTPTESEEVKTAIRSKKVVKECKMKFVKGDTSPDSSPFAWVFNLKTAGLQLTGIKLPHADATDLYERFKQRVSLLDELNMMLGELFAQFLAIRLVKENWSAARLEIENWINSDQSV